MAPSLIALAVLVCFPENPAPVDFSFWAILITAPGGCAACVMPVFEIVTPEPTDLVCMHLVTDPAPGEVLGFCVEASTEPASICTQPSESDEACCGAYILPWDRSSGGPLPRDRPISRPDQ